MILYDLACASGHRFEAALESMRAENPPCECGAPTRRLLSRLNVGGAASAGPSRDDMPNTWHGTGRGNPEVLRGWHQAMTRREKLEEKYPELAGDRRPVLAHEGVFADRPLKAGDDLAPAVSEATFARKSPARPSDAPRPAATNPGGTASATNTRPTTGTTN
ncbi:MAG: zinc ribbon domain-containing protein [Nigerium sp.]|nr:zinc ribbon domain-containing protein [Nigerium sp.]